MHACMHYFDIERYCRDQGNSQLQSVADCSWQHTWSRTLPEIQLPLLSGDRIFFSPAIFWHFIGCENCSNNTSVVFVRLKH